MNDIYKIDSNTVQNTDNTCPCCPRHCDLSAPSCPRGREYASTGKMPEREPHDHDGERRGSMEDHRHGHPEDGEIRGMEHRRHHINLVEHPRYAEMSVDDKLSALLQELGFRRRFSADGKAGQARILRILSKHGPMSQRELTEKLGIQPGSASEILGKLEKAGLLQRQPDEGDRRTFTVSLTEEGTARAADSEKAQSADVHKAFSVLSDEEKETLLCLGEKLYRAWNEQHCGHGRHHEHHGHEHN